MLSPVSTGQGNRMWASTHSSCLSEWPSFMDVLGYFLPEYWSEFMLKMQLCCMYTGLLRKPSGADAHNSSLPPGSIAAERHTEGQWLRLLSFLSQARRLEVLV